MPNRKLDEYVRSLFAPLVSAASFSKPAVLKTKAIPPDRRQEQFMRFRKLRFSASKVLPLPNGGFLTIAAEANKEILMLCAPSLNQDERDELVVRCIDDLNLEEIEFDETMLLVGNHELPNIFRLTGEFRSRAKAADLLGTAETQGYQGHSIYDIKDCFQPVLAFKIEKDNVLFNCDPVEVALRLLILSNSLRSPIVDEETSNLIVALHGLPGCASSNLFQALTASHARYVFLDVYRCLEALFPFPWMKELKAEIGGSIALGKLRRDCRTALGWNAKEDKSIEKLFEIVDDGGLALKKQSVNLFGDLISDHAPASSFARRVYSVRNGLVHHEDRDGGARSILVSQDLYQLTRFLCSFIQEFERKFGPEFRS